MIEHSRPPRHEKLVYRLLKELEACERGDPTSRAVTRFVGSVRCYFDWAAVRLAVAFQRFCQDPRSQAFMAEQFSEEEQQQIADRICAAMDAGFASDDPALADWMND